MTDRADTSFERRAGIVVPLFSCPSSESWGIGDIGDLEPLTAWLSEAGIRVLQMLPLNEMAPGQQSPYSAISAMALDPIFIRVPAVADFAALGGEAALSASDREVLAAVRASRSVQHAAVRRLKRSALRAAFERFVDVEWRHDTERARSLRSYLSEQAWWIEDYSLFRALHAHEGGRPWTTWPAELQRRDPASIDHVRRELAHEVLFFQYLQWIAGLQWRRARLETHGVQLFGDLPFMVDRDSADVWVRQHQFHLDVSVGAPPDAFSATGQNWGMPLYDWEGIAREDFRWLHERARRSADLFDGYRIDHLVGFYRTYGYPEAGGDGFFTPPDEPSQTQLGEQVLAAFRSPGAEIIAEDLGTVPDFVRASLARLGIPGFRVFRWERRWHEPGTPFRDPADYPLLSVAATGTHDTDALAVWWDEASADERSEILSLPTMRLIGGELDPGATPYIPQIRDALLESLYASSSGLLLVPMQDVFGWRDRINEPATVTDANWTYRLPWPIERWDGQPEALERKDTLRRWAEHHGRL